MSQTKNMVAKEFCNILRMCIKMYSLFCESIHAFLLFSKIMEWNNKPIHSKKNVALNVLTDDFINSSV